MSAALSHVLVVDDHREIRDALARYLTQQGLRVSVAANAAAARKLLDSRLVDVVVLDVMMPGEDGFSLCRHIRETRGVPVIFLSARSEEVDRVMGLQIGGDDYLVKPFSPRELLARIHAVHRRAHELPPNRQPPTTRQFRFAGMTLDAASREIIRADGTVVYLSSTEFQLLLTLLEHAQVVLSREQLLERLRGRVPEAFERSIDTQISRLRRKLQDNAKEPRLIKTAWGSGYVLATEVERL
jgi:two-component system, OmpR family, response regulator